MLGIPGGEVAKVADNSGQPEDPESRNLGDATISIMSGYILSYNLSLRI